MWQKFLTALAGPLLDILVKGIQKAVTAIVGTVADGMRTNKHNKLNERLDTIEAELRRKPRTISKDEAADIARRLSDIRTKL